MTFKNDNVYINFVGTKVRAFTYNEFFASIDNWLNDKTSRSHHVAIINAYCATCALSNTRLNKIYKEADIVAPDGRPFVYWLRLFTRRHCEQFDASSILINLAKRSKEKGYTFYLYGGHPEVLEQMQLNLKKMFPYIKIVGAYSPPFRPLSEDEDKEITDAINNLKPDIICVGLGTPKQDYWIYEHKEKIRGAVFIPCGAVFDFFGGRIKRAPKIVSVLGIEWLYRLFSKDFKRLWYRYTVMNIIFLWNFCLQRLRIKCF